MISGHESKQSREQPPDYQPMRSKFFDRISGWSKEPVQQFVSFNLIPSLQHIFLFSSPSSKITPFFDTLQDWNNSTNKLTEYAREYQGTYPYPGKKRVQITDSGERRIKETITTVLKAVVLGGESIVGTATTDDDLKELGAVAGAVIHAIKKAEVPADWGWEGRYYEIVKIYE
ncbi:hypothetical protein ACHAPG_009668 [Botrytis cinerea]